MKILDVLYEFYGDFEFIKEKWNEKYEGILIKIKDEQGYKRCRLAKRTPKKEGYFTVFWKTKLLFVRKFSRQKTAKEKCPCDFIRLGAQI